MNIFETQAQTTVIDTPVFPHNLELRANRRDILAVRVLPLTKGKYKKLTRLWMKKYTEMGYSIQNPYVDMKSHTTAWTWEISFNLIEFATSNYNWDEYPNIKVDIIENNDSHEPFPHFYSLPFIVKEYEVWFGMLFHWVKAQKEQYNIDVPIEFLFLEETFIEQYGSKYGFINPRKEEQEEIS